MNICFVSLKSFIAKYFFPVLVERVFLRIGSAETDEQLENVLGKFLAPSLLKLNSSDEMIRKKVGVLMLSHDYFTLEGLYFYFSLSVCVCVCLSIC